MELDLNKKNDWFSVKIAIQKADESALIGLIQAIGDRFDEICLKQFKTLQDKHSLNLNAPDAERDKCIVGKQN